jgi:hypothetical protein
MPVSRVKVEVARVATSVAVEAVRVVVPAAAETAAAVDKGKVAAADMAAKG